MNVAFEEQNAVLQRHTQSMSSARERLEQELALEERRTLALQQQLQAVRQALTASFASLPNVVVIDGGKGQLAAGLGPLRGFRERGVAVISLAKRIEEIFAQYPIEQG